MFTTENPRRHRFAAWESVSDPFRKWMARLAAMQAAYERKRHFQSLSVDDLRDIGLYDETERDRLSQRPFWKF